MISKTYFQFAFNFACFFIASLAFLLTSKNDPTWMRTACAAAAFTTLLFFFHALFTGLKRKKQERQDKIDALRPPGQYHYQVTLKYTDKDGNEREQ